ncbi:MAG: hypothetical protein GX275_13650 [Clostridiales bacterium]|nr:hypothetical protein [Clostridiales bacterium]
MKKLKRILMVTILGTMLLGGVMPKAYSTADWTYFTNNYTGLMRPLYKEYTSYSTHRAVVRTHKNWADNRYVLTFCNWQPPGNKASVCAYSYLIYAEGYGENM